MSTDISNLLGAFEELIKKDDVQMTDLANFHDLLAQAEEGEQVDLAGYVCDTVIDYLRQKFAMQKVETASGSAANSFLFQKAAIQIAEENGYTAAANYLRALNKKSAVPSARMSGSKPFGTTLH